MAKSEVILNNIIIGGQKLNFRDFYHSGNPIHTIPVEKPLDQSDWSRDPKYHKILTAKRQRSKFYGT